MESVQDVTISSFNEQVDVIREESKDVKTSISLTLFDEKVRGVFFNEPVDKLEKLDGEKYSPGGMTAMCDAICCTIAKMEEEIHDIGAPNVSVLFVLITDGLENSSASYTSKDVSDTIKRLKESGRWTFSVMGANIDLNNLADQFNIDRGNMLKISATGAGITRGTSTASNAYSKYFKMRRAIGEAESYQSSSLYSDTNEITDISDESVAAEDQLSITDKSSQK